MGKKNLVTQKKKVGRKLGQTKYTEDQALALIDKYLQDCKSKLSTPYVEELAVFYFDCDDDTLVEYAKKWSRFSAALKKLKTMQKARLQNQTTSMAIFLLKANHKMVETSRTELTGQDGNPIELKVTDILNELKKEPDVL